VIYVRCKQKRKEGFKKGCPDGLKTKAVLLLPRQLCRAISRLAPLWRIYISLNYRMIFFTTKIDEKKIISRSILAEY
jgi:hypothetical protein